MPGRRWTAGIAVVATMAFGASSQALAAQRFVSPSGSGTACSSGSPCTIQTAFSVQSTGDEIIVAPGDYTVASTLAIQTGVYVHGTAGQPAPRLHLASGAYLGDATTGSHASYLQLDGISPASLQVGSDSQADQIYVHTSANGACLVYGVLLDSVCWTTSTDDNALGGGTSGSDSIFLRNVTAEATGPGDTAIDYDISGSGNTSVTAVNVIARGTASPDVLGEAISPAHLTINLDHSNVGSAGGSGNGVNINSSSIQNAPPQFVNAAAGDFNEIPGSPTIDAGITSAANGPFDVFGKPRVLGGGTDIGATEFDPFNGVAIGTGKVRLKKGKAPVTLTCPAGTPPPCAGTLTLSYRHGSKTSVAGKAQFSLDAGASAKVKVKLKKPARSRLDDRGKLKVSAFADATDGIGTTAGASGKIKIKA